MITSSNLCFSSAIEEVRTPSMFGEINWKVYTINS